MGNGPQVSCITVWVSSNLAKLQPVLITHSNYSVKSSLFHGDFCGSIDILFVSYPDLKALTPIADTPRVM